MAPFISFLTTQSHNIYSLWICMHIFLQVKRIQENNDFSITVVAMVEKGRWQKGERIGVE